MVNQISGRRVYLDTAILAAIGDGRVDSAHVVQLHDAFRDTGSHLVVSFAHCLDAVRNTDAATRRRFARAVNAFPRVAIVAAVVERGESEALRSALAEDGPPTVPTAPWDLPLIAVRDIEEEVFSNPHVLQNFEAVARVMMQATDAARVAWSQREPEPPSSEYVAGVAEMLPRLLAATRPEDLLPPGANLDDPAMVAAREGIRALWPTVAALRANVVAASTRGEVDLERLVRNSFRHPGSAVASYAASTVRGGFARWLEVAAVVAPGHFLIAELRKANDSNSQREPTYSDIADRSHVSLVPYVDLATVDANNHGAMMRALRRATTRRPVRLLRNPGTNLSELVRAVRELPDNSQEGAG